ncbi:sulfite exporter TauE/SafE family protein [bacterium]|nr:sulfite exporter TauE/SafE family protein [bacterium]MBU1984456.1 sulfite exporter TauE/SafE family protein [bacterium]
MDIPFLWLFLLGFGTGVVGGFLGIGGGVIITVVLLEWFKAQGIPLDLRFHLAFGTTLLAIFGTAASATATYARMKRVLWPAATIMGAAAVATSLLGSWLAAESSGPVLKTFLAAFCVVNAILLLRNSRASSDGNSRKALPKYLVIGALAGLVSAYLGLAGGVVMVPLMLLWVRLPAEKAPGTSSAVGILTSLVGAVGYAWQGSGAAHLPEGAWGFVLPSLAIPVMIGTIAGAPIGSLLNRRFGRKSFRYAFAIFLILMAARVYFKG